MHDEDIEQRLKRYRPAGPSPELAAAITRLPDSPMTRFPRTWPWAIAAAALLAISVGLHAPAAAPAPVLPAVDTERVRTIAADLGGRADSQVLAEWIVREEVISEQRARMARAVSEDERR